MESLREAASTYRLIVTRRNASEILLLPDGSGWALPRVEIRPQQRLAEQLTAEASKASGVEAYCLLILNLPPCSPDGEAKCAVMESARQNDKAPTGTYWVPRTAAGSCVEAREARLIREALDELNVYATNKKPGPFARPGWLRELFRWTQEQVAPFGLRLTGSFRQLNASPAFSLIRLETNDGALWFKATGAPNLHELPITLSLARLFPGNLPTVLGVHETWNGWLSEEVAGTTLDQIGDPISWERVARNLAELQIASIQEHGELLKAGCQDLTLARLVNLIDPFLGRMAELMAAQEKESPAPLTDSQLSFLARHLSEACFRLEKLGFSDTVGHMDFNPGNVVISQERCVFLDWAEACLTTPFVTFEHLREHARRHSVHGVDASAKINAAYLQPWRSFLSPAEIAEALALSPLIAVFAYAVAGSAWRSLETIHDRAQAGYLRSLTRRMYHEAARAVLRSEPCPICL